VLEYNRGGSYLSCDAAPILLGLGTDRQAEEVTIAWPSGVDSTRYALAGDRRHLLVEPAVTVEAIGAARPIGPDWIEVPVRVKNHAARSERVDLSAGIALGDIRAEFPSLSLPGNLGARAETTLNLYLPIPYSAMGLVHSLGVWLQVNADSRGTGRDELEMPMR
jgi:hypothetical protein